MGGAGAVPRRVRPLSSPPRASSSAEGRGCAAKRGVAPIACLSGCRRHKRTSVRDASCGFAAPLGLDGWGRSRSAPGPSIVVPVAGVVKRGTVGCAARFPGRVGPPALKPEAQARNVRGGLQRHGVLSRQNADAMFCREGQTHIPRLRFGLQFPCSTPCQKTLPHTRLGCVAKRGVAPIACLSGCRRHKRTSVRDASCGFAAPIDKLSGLPARPFTGSARLSTSF